MESLTARFNINLKVFSGYLIGEAETSTFSTVFNAGECGVEIEMGSSNVPSMGHADFPAKRFFFDRLVISISAKTTLEEIAQFGKDPFFYFSTREKYQLVLIDAVNRIISYFKYILHNPMLRLWTYEDLLRDEKHCFGPSWFLNGKDVTPDWGDFGTKAPVFTIQGGRFLNQYGFGIEKLTPQFHSDFEAFLLNPTKPRLFDQLLSDSQSVDHPSSCPTCTINAVIDTMNGN